jgi:hypothetical protein
MDKKLTSEELQEINRFTEQFAHQTEDRKNVLSLLSHIEQLEKETETTDKWWEEESDKKDKEIKKLERHRDYYFKEYLLSQAKAQRLEEALNKVRTVCVERHQTEIRGIVYDIVSEAIKEVRGE